MIRLSGLWKNVSDSGEKYLSGNIGSGKILIFKNKNKQTESDADYIMYVTDKSKHTSEDYNEEDAFIDD